MRTLNGKATRDSANLTSGDETMHLFTFLLNSHKGLQLVKVSITCNLMKYTSISLTKRMMWSIWGSEERKGNIAPLDLVGALVILLSTMNALATCISCRFLAPHDKQLTSVV